MIFDKLGTRSVIITGESGAEKTTTVRELLSRWEGSAFILDVTNEYAKDFKEVDFGGMFSAAPWKRG